MSAFFSAGESLTPSPVTATMAPWRWQASTMMSFCCGEVRAEYDFRVVDENVVDLRGSHVAEVPAVDHTGLGLARVHSVNVDAQSLCNVLHRFVTSRDNTDTINTFKQSIDWLIDLVFDCLIVRLFDWWIDWLIKCLIDWLIDWSIDWLIDWSSVWSTDWLIDQVFDRLIDWLIDRLIDWLIH